VERPDLSERILGVIRIFTLDLRNLIKHLYFTTNRIIVVKITKIDGRKNFSGLDEPAYVKRMEDKERELSGLSPDKLLHNDADNIAIPMSEIEKVTLSKSRFLRARYITIETRQKKYRWQATGVPPVIKVAEFERFVEILQPIFMEKLVVKKPK
jgi:hypothetical protein